MDHSARARALAQLAVLPQLYRGVAYIGIGIHEGSDRRIGVERFAATKLLLLFLQIAIGDIEADGVTENVLECIVRADIFRASADHDGQFSSQNRFGARETLFRSRRDVPAESSVP